MLLKWICVVGYVGQIAPANLTGTALGLSSTCIFIIGKGLGSVVGGYIAEHLSTRWMFRLYGITYGSLGVLYCILYHTYLKHTELSRKLEKQNVDTTEKQTKEDDLDINMSNL